MNQSLQDTYAPKNRCFGCGPANDKGLRIKSFADGEEVVCRWRAEPHHQAWTGVVNGGVVGCLFDCHCNWVAAWHLFRKRNMEGELPSTVTSDFHVKLQRPTSSTDEITIRARAVESTNHRAVVEATMEVGGKITATCRGTFVAVEEGHPAYHRWQ